MVNTADKDIIERLNSIFKRIKENRRPRLISTPFTKEGVVTQLNKETFEKLEIEDFLEFEYNKENGQKTLSI